MLERVIEQACDERDVRQVVVEPPKMINEKELYGC